LNSSLIQRMQGSETIDVGSHLDCSQWRFYSIYSAALKNIYDTQVILPCMLIHNKCLKDKRI
jgi:hypothetical protein